ncbi:MAG: MxaL protein [Burkholderiaceae bacterium]|nr:MxaL protein [Burkholderiaceae bacterium]
MSIWQRASDGGNWRLALPVLLLALAVWSPRVLWQRPVFTWQVSFDITQSMNVQDVELHGAPISRLELARAAMRNVLAELPCGSKVGWSIFTDYRSLILLAPIEVCSHYEELLASLERIDGRMRWANASNIGRGATWAVRGARSLGPHTSFVFITDGQEAPPLRFNAKPARPLYDLPGAEQASSQRSLSETLAMGDITPGEVKGWLIGVGGDVPVPIPRIGSDGQPAGYWKAEDVVQGSAIGGTQNHEHLSELRQDYMKLLAKALDVNYLRLDTPDALKTAMLDRRYAQSQLADVDLRWIPALLALLLLAWRFLPDLGLRRGRRL